MKKILVLLISIILSLSVPFSIYAIVQNNSTPIVEDGLEKYDYIKALLSDIGMDSYFIERLNESQLERYYNAIVRARNEDLSTNSLADNAANPRYDIAPMALQLPGQTIHDPDGGYPIYTRTYSDEWMIMFLAVTYMGDGIYFYSIDASWNQIPSNLYTDSLGMMSESSRVLRDTVYAWHEGKYLGIDGTTSYSTFEQNYDQNSPYFFQGASGAWSGMAYVFALPEFCKTTTNFMGILEKISVHLEYEARVENVLGIIPFSVSSNYDHTVRQIDIDLSFGVNIAPPSIGFNLNINTQTDIHRRNCEILEQLVYYPD